MRNVVVWTTVLKPRTTAVTLMAGAEAPSFIPCFRQHYGHEPARDDENDASLVDSMSQRMKMPPGDPGCHFVSYSTPADDPT